jgi:DNA-directed RNA polymerase subunit alpha
MAKVEHIVAPIRVPEQIEVLEEDKQAAQATFVITPYYPGYGVTLGNALRRVLLSSLPGSAITAVQIEGVEHEYTALPHIKENVLAIVLNLKQLRVKLADVPTPQELKLEARGERVVKARDIKAPAGVEIVNPELVIATLTHPDAKLNMRMKVERGRGFVAVEERDEERRPIGEIALDAIYTPVRRVSFRVENVRVGKETDYNKLIITIATDGTITPREALTQGAKILADHFAALAGEIDLPLTQRGTATPEEKTIPAAAAAKEKEKAPPERSIEELPLSTRTIRALQAYGIEKIGHLLRRSAEELQDIPGIGEKAVGEIEAALRKLKLKLADKTV